MSPHAAVAQLAELPTIAGEGPGDAAWTPIRHALGIGAFGVNAWHGAAPGDVVIEPHDEIPGSEGACAGHEELYLVLRGRARFVIDGTDLDAPEGTLVALPPHLRREAVAVAAGTLVLAVGAPRGEAFSPAPWEQRAIDAAGLL